MPKRKLREWEIPMNLSQEERKEFNTTTEDQLNWSAKKETHPHQSSVEFK